MTQDTICCEDGVLFFQPEAAVIIGMARGMQDMKCGCCQGIRGVVVIQIEHLTVSKILQWYVFREVVHVEVMILAIQGERVFVDSDR